MKWKRKKRPPREPWDYHYYEYGKYAAENFFVAFIIIVLNFIALCIKECMHPHSVF